MRDRVAQKKNRALLNHLLPVVATSHVIDPEVVATQFQQVVGDVISALFPVVATEEHDGMPRWVLKPSVRRRVLADFDPHTSLPLPPLASKLDSDRQTLLRHWLSGDLTDLRQAIENQPDALRQVAGWLSDSANVTPRPRDVLQRLAVADLRAKHKRTASENFLGRKDELDLLDELTSHAPWSAIIEAPGGMGKSALIASFLLQQKAYTDDGPIAIVLDLDAPDLTPSRPDYIYAEMARQAAIQTVALDGVEGELRNIADRTETLESVHADAGYNDAHTDSLARFMFSSLVATGRTVYLALDTLERPRHTIPDLLETFLERLIANIRSGGNQRPEQLRLLVAGRGPIASPSLEAIGARTIPLGPLKRDRAAKLLADLEVPHQFIHKILDRFDAAPLTLRLAAQALSSGATEVVDDDDALEKVRRARGNGYLQLRILDHLPSDRLAEVAKRALLLGTITPERMASIVGPMMEPPITLAEANALFNDLAKVVEVVNVPDPSERSMVLRAEVADDIAELSAVVDRDMVVAVRKAAVTALSASDAVQDRDDVERHRAWLTNLALPGVLQVPITAGNREGLESLTPTNAPTLSDVRRELDALISSNRLGEALALVEANAIAHRDIDILIKAARAARRAGDADRCEQFADLAKLVATTELQQAQACVMIMWAITRRGITSDELRKKHAAFREQARRAWDQGASIQGTVIERAEVLAELADEEPEWVRLALQAMFHDHGWASLADADRDLVRQIGARASSMHSLEWAAKLGGFDGAYPGKLQVESLAVAFVDAEVSYLGSGDDAGAMEDAILERQRSGEFGRTVVEVLYFVQGRGDALEARVHAELANLLDQFRGIQRRTVKVDLSSRARALEELTARLVRNFEPVTWRKLVGSMGDRQISRQATSNDLDLAVRSVLTEIDRRGRGEDFAKALSEHGLDNEATLAREALTYEVEKRS